jgi:YjbE family integral membrane protein
LPGYARNDGDLREDMFNFSSVFTPTGMASLGQIIIGDLTMAGDNVVIMGSLASGLPERDRRKVLLFGVGMALVFLVTFALIATQLLKVTGLVFAGGLLLLWVAYNMVRELHPAKVVISDDPETPQVEGPKPTKTLLQAAIQIMVADLSMSLDNVLLVASIARENPALLFIGLTFSVLFMGFAANYVARLIQRFHWINYVGLAVILYVAVNMIREGWVGGEHVLGLRNVLGVG